MKGQEKLLKICVTISFLFPKLWCGSLYFFATETRRPRDSIILEIRVIRKSYLEISQNMALKDFCYEKLSVLCDSVANIFSPNSYIFFNSKFY